MVSLNELYNIAEKLGVKTQSISCANSQAVTIDVDGACYIGLDNSVVKNEVTERLVLAHELGHAATGAYYSLKDSEITIKRMEYRASKWTVERLVPKQELAEQLREDITVWDLAEHFNVSPDMIKKAMWFYFKKELL